VDCVRRSVLSRAWRKYFTLYSVMARRTTQRPMGFAAVRLPQTDRELWFAASKLLGVSQSEFLRTALRERAERVLASVATRMQPR
jgi:hypothetical protein